MDMHDIVERVSAWEGVLTLRPGPGDGSPEISWGDVLFYVAPDGRVPAGQPFATIITKDYPGEPSAGLDRPGSFRVNVAGGRRGRPGAPHADAAPDPSTPDQVLPHPAHAERAGWPWSTPASEPASRSRPCYRPHTGQP